MVMKIKLKILSDNKWFNVKGSTIETKTLNKIGKYTFLIKLIIENSSNDLRMKRRTIPAVKVKYIEI